LVDEKTGDLWGVHVSADGKKNDWTKLKAGVVMMNNTTPAGYLLPDGNQSCSSDPPDAASTGRSFQRADHSRSRTA
jgi:hypothetical protein